MKNKTYTIKFTSRTWAAIALWELHAWEVSDAKYRVNFEDETIFHANANVVDIIIESIPKCYFSFVIETN
mgnify:CR=1 FL=1